MSKDKPKEKPAPFTPEQRQYLANYVRGFMAAQEDKMKGRPPRPNNGLPPKRPN
jgi:hypothetical protein